MTQHRAHSTVVAVVVVVVVVVVVTSRSDAMVTVCLRHGPVCYLP